MSFTFYFKGKLLENIIIFSGFCQSNSLEASLMWPQESNVYFDSHNIIAKYRHLLMPLICSDESVTRKEVELDELLDCEDFKE